MHVYGLPKKKVDWAMFWAVFSQTHVTLGSISCSFENFFFEMRANQGDQIWVNFCLMGHCLLWVVY
jgi:hypothetical protein